MRKTFGSRPTKDVTITRDGHEPITFTVCGLPNGWIAELQEMFPAVTYENGKPVPLTGGAASAHLDLMMHIRLAKGLELDGEGLETVLPGPKASANEWRAAAIAVREEFRAAGFVEGEVAHILAGVLEMTSGAKLARRVKDAAGN